MFLTKPSRDFLIEKQEKFFVPLALTSQLLKKKHRFSYACTLRSLYLRRDFSKYRCFCVCCIQYVFHTCEKVQLLLDVIACAVFMLREKIQACNYTV